MAKDTPSRLVMATARLLQYRGYHGTSLNDILTESGAPRGSLYFHFPGGKEQLALEATRIAVDGITLMLRETLEKSTTPAQAVRAFVEAAAFALRESDYTFGCPVSPLVLDATADLTEIAELCRQAYEEWVGIWQSTLLENGIAEHRARALALLIESSVDGSLLIARAYRDIGPLLAVAAELEAVVEAALPRWGQDER